MTLKPTVRSKWTTTCLTSRYIPIHRQNQWDVSAPGCIKYLDLFSKQQKWIHLDVVLIPRMSSAVALWCFFTCKFRTRQEQLFLILSWLMPDSLVSLLPGKTCRVALSLRSTVPWCSETWGSVSVSTTRTIRWMLSDGWLIGQKNRHLIVLVFILLTEIVPPSAQNSLTRSAPLNSDSQGRFGNRFLTTYDHRFVIKTVSSEDIAEMHNILKKYHQVGARENKHPLSPAFTFLTAILPANLVHSPPPVICSLLWSATATRCSHSSWACTG